MSQCNPEMVCIVEGIEKVFVERMNVLKSRKSVKNGCELFGKGFGGVFDLANVKSCAKRSQPLLSLPSSRRVDLPLILVIANPALICVGRRLCVRLRTMSRNSCDVGTGAISFQVVFILNMSCLVDQCSRAKNEMVRMDYYQDKNLGGRLEKNLTARGRNPLIRFR